ncbi:hypothetical protein KR054_007848, partial [Drosophila jambulina]
MSLFRHPSMTARQRQSRTARMTRHSIFTMKRPSTFQVRKSLVEFVDAELLDMDTSVFYQRIFILAKNVDLTTEEAEVETEPEPVQVDAETVPVSQPGLEFKEALIIPMDDFSYGSAEGDEEEASLEAPSEVVRTSADPDREVLTHTFRFSGQDTVEEELIDEEEEPATGSVVAAAVKPKDFFDIFIEVLQELHTQCKAVAITPDPMCGLYLYMGEYSLLMLEGSEDMMGCFTRDLAEVCGQYWVTNRVFQIEDHITELYTKDLMFRRVPAIYLNEKFPTSTPTDEYLMGKQHLIIKDKLQTICRMVSEGDQLLDVDEPSGYDSLDEEDDTGLMKYKSKSYIVQQMPVDTYRKHIPEIQRIELVLASTRFYYELAGFTKLYGQVPFARDEEGHFWPISNNYTPPNIFRRTPYDINLTFAGYASAAKGKRTESLVSEQSGEGDAADEDGAAKEE